MDTRQIVEEAGLTWSEITSGEFVPELYAGSLEKAGAFYLGDNIPVTASFVKKIKSGEMKPVSLVYMDPPYFTNREYSARIKVETEVGSSYVNVPAFSDTWKYDAAGGSQASAIENYLHMLTMRLIAAREILAMDGCLWLHMDRHAVHYAKVICDEVFGGPDHLVNEVVWTYKSGGSSKRRFANKHDTLLFYAKDKKKYKFSPLEEKSYNRALKPYRFKGVKEYRDDTGWYTIVNMKDVWEIPMVGRTAGERTGYATQKPEALLERIVLACTEPGDICMDPFCGSGTLAAVCKKHGRSWICIDENRLALELATKRLGLG